MRDAYRFWWETVMEIDHLEDLSIERRVILKLISNRSDGEALTGLNWLRRGTGGGHL